MIQIQVVAHKEHPFKIDTFQNSMIQLKGTALFLFVLILLNITSHLLVNVLDQIKEVWRINVPCVLIGTREYLSLLTDLILICQAHRTSVNSRRRDQEPFLK